MSADPVIYNQILIELTDFCNLDCGMCSRAITGNPYMHAHKTSSFMNLNTLDNIFRNLDNFWHTPLSVKLFWCGESLLHPEFDDILRRASEFCRQKNCYVDLHTNAIFLDRYMECILKHSDCLPRITFSVDALSQGVYRKIRKGGDLGTAVRNIESFLQARKTLDSEFPKIVIQFILLEDNREECDRFIKRWHDALVHFDTGGTDMDTIWIKKAEGLPGNRLEITGVLFRDFLEGFEGRFSDRVRIITDEDNRWPTGETVTVPDLRVYCGAPFTSPVIASDGSMTCCCLDSDLLLSPGNVNEESFSKLWFSKSLQDLRKNMFRGKDLPGICSDCAGYSRYLHRAFLEKIYPESLEDR